MLFNFSPRLHFLHVLVPKMRGNLWKKIKNKKRSVVLILTEKMEKLGVNVFLLMRGVLYIKVLGFHMDLKSRSR